MVREQTVAIESRTVLVEGVQTAYVEAGEGPDVLLVHGSGPGVSGAGAWRTLIPRLARDFHVVAPDLLGFGGTEPTADSRYGRHRWAGHVAAFTQAVGLESFGLVATSMGGAIALTIAHDHPARVRRQVLVGSMGIDLPITRELDRLWGYVPDRAALRAALLTLAYDESLITDELVEARYAASLVPGTRASYESMFPAPRERWVDDLSLTRVELGAVEQPTLLVHGLDDPVIRLQDSSRRLVEALPDARMHVFARCKHWPMVEHELEFADLVGGFLSGTEEPSPYGAIGQGPQGSCDGRARAGS